MIRIPFLSRARLPSIVPLALLLPLAACGGDAAAAGPTVRDSAGIRIVRNDVPAWKDGEGWSVADEAAVDIGVVDGEAAYQLDGVSGVARLSDGRIVVADGGSRQLRFFSAEGRHLASAGRDGGGPGEFQQLSWVGVSAGDSVLAWDAEGARLSVFDSTGRFVRAFKPAGLHMHPGVEGFLGAGALLMTPGWDPMTVLRDEGEYRETAVWMRAPLDGGAPRELSRRPGQERFFGKDGEMFTSEPVVFGRGVFVAGATDGFYAGDSDRYEVEHHGPDGALRRLIRRAHVPRPVTGADVEAYFAARGGMKVSGMPAAERARWEAAQRARRDRLPRRATLPAFAQLLVDGKGNLWVRDPQPRREEAHAWSVFDPEGRWLGTVRTPAGFDVKQIGADWILGTAKDELDVEHVRVYRIQKPGVAR
jgi:hypothetical protein